MLDRSNMISHHLGHPTPEVSPTTSRGVCGTHELLDKDLRRPELGTDESRAHHTDEEADYGHVYGTLHKATEGGGD